jgi:hypothetical protein
MMQSSGVPKDLNVVISGDLAVTLANHLGYAGLMLHHKGMTALEARLLEAIRSAELRESVGLPEMPRGCDACRPPI